MILVEFTGASQWYNAALTISSGWLKSGGKISYSATVHSPEDIRAGLRRLGVNYEECEREDKLRIWDFYAATLGMKSNEKFAYDSLKAADLSLRTAKEDMREAPQPEWLRVIENSSTWYRFNDEKTMMEVELSRFIPSFKVRQSTAIRAIMRDIHSNWVLQQLEGAHDGIIDFKLDESTDPAQNLFRIRSFRNVGYDGRWRKVGIGKNFEVTLA